MIGRMRILRSITSEWRMTRLDYNDYVEDLIKNTEVQGNEVFQYSETPMEHICDELFQFFQNNLDLKFPEYSITPAKFFFNSGRTVNGWAWNNSSQYIICIYIGAIHKFKTLLLDKECVFGTGASYREYKEIEPFLDSTLNRLLFQSCCLFIYYHEIGHLIQFSDEVVEKLYEDPVTKTSYTELKHVREIDADMFSAIRLSRHIAQYWRKLPSDHQTLRNLELLISLVCTGASAFKLHNIEFSGDLYFKEKTHPHSLIRTFLIIDTIVNYSKSHNQEFEGIKLDLENLVRTCLLLIDELIPKILTEGTRSKMIGLYRSGTYGIFDYCQELIRGVRGDKNSAIAKRNKMMNTLGYR